MKNTIAATYGSGENGGGRLQDGKGAADLELKKQSFSANMNLMSYQTANFGPNGETRPIGKDREAPTEEETNNEAATTVAAPSGSKQPDQQMFASMSDLNFVAAAANQSSTKAVAALNQKRSPAENKKTANLETTVQ